MKKAQMLMMAKVVALLLLLFSLALLLGIFPKIFNRTLDEEVINAVCRESVLFNAERRVPGVEAETIKVKCATKFVTLHEEYAEMEYESNPLDSTRGNEPIRLDNRIYKTDLKQGGKKCKDSDDPELCMFNNINKIIADEIARCWINFHRGTRRVFSLYTKDRQCVVCSVIFFDNLLRQNYGAHGLIGIWNEAYSLDNFMRNNCNLRMTGEDNYYHYTLDLIDQTWQLPYYDYDMDSDYAVTFVALNKNAVNSIVTTLWEKIKELITDYDPDYEQGNYVNTLEFVANEMVPTRCDEWA